MDVRLRKYVIWALSFGALALGLGIYMHFSRTSIPSPIDRSEPNQLLFDLIQGQSTKVGDVEIMALEDVVWDERDEFGRRIRRWRFKQLLNRGGNVIEVSQPSMTLFKSDLSCHITAEQGRVHLRAGRGDLIPKDFIFSGDVLIHIVPESRSSLDEVHIHLDDITFVSDTSVCSTDGPIKLVSDSVKLEGRGVEFVYSKLAQRIEYFKLIDLFQLRIKAPKDKLFPDANDLPAADPNAAPTLTLDTRPAPKQTDQALEGQYYDCTLHQNVIVTTPKELVFARDRLALTHIFWPKDAWSADAKDTRRTETDDVVTPADDPHAGEGPTPELVDVSIGCDKGMLLLPQASPWQGKDLGLSLTQGASAEHDPNVARALGNAGFVSQTISHNLQKRNTQAEGPLELTYYAEDVNAPTPQQKLVPIKVTAEDYGTHDAQSGRIVLQGNCVCTLVRVDPNVMQHHSLQAPIIALGLADNKDGESIAARPDLKHLEAYGGRVRLRVVTRARADVNEPQLTEPQIGDLLAGVELECQRVEYDPNNGQGVFTATGPGIIWLNNAQAQDMGTVGPQERPCYAFLDGFETLKYFVAEDRITAHAQGKSMQFRYLPLIDGQVGPSIDALANHVEIELFKTHTGDLGLSRLTATGDIHCIDNDKGWEFTGDGLAYDHRRTSLHIWSDTDEPCRINGLPVPEIRYNLKTKDLQQIELIGQGVVPTP